MGVMASPWFCSFRLWNKDCRFERRGSSIKAESHFLSAPLFRLHLQCPVDVNFGGKCYVLKINFPKFDYKSLMEIKDEKHIFFFQLVSFV